jgi:phage-related protein
MERLLADAEKISGIKYDISSFADISEAIHVMQTEMGIAGSTAQEAASTIEGSLSMMKASWQNLIVGMADENANMDVLINNLVESTTTAASNIMPRIEQTLGGIGQVVEKLAPVIADALPGLVSSVLPSLVNAASGLLSSLVAALPSLIGTFVNDIFPQVISAIVTLFNELVAMLPSLLGTLANALVSNAPVLINAAISMLLAVLDILPDLVKMVCDILPSAIITIVGALTSNIPALIDGVLTCVVGIINALPDIIKGLLAVLPDLIQMVVDTLIANVPMLIDACIMIVQALILALPDIIMALVEALPSILQSVWDGITQFFANIPQWFGQLFGKAWDFIKEAFSLDKVGEFFSSIWNGIKNAFGAVADWFKNIFSNAWQAVKNVFSSGGKIFDGIKDGIVNAFKAVVNAIIGGLNKVIAIPFNAINGILNFIRNIDILGITPFSGLWKQDPLAVPQIPKLATGLNYVPYDEYPALLHRGEAVLTAAEARQWRKNGIGGEQGIAGITIIQNIQSVPLTPVELAATTEAYFEQARWAF